MPCLESCDTVWPMVRRNKAQATEIAHRGSADPLASLEAENAELRKRLNLPARTGRGRPLKRSTQDSYITKRLAKLVKGRDAKAFIRAAYSDGIGPADIRAMGAALWEILNIALAEGEINPGHYAGTAAKLMQTFVKLLELDAIEAAEVPGTINILIQNMSEADPGPGDVIEVG